MYMPKRKEYYFNIIKHTKIKGNSYYIRITDNINFKTFHHENFFNRRCDAEAEIRKLEEKYRKGEINFENQDLSIKEFLNIFIEERFRTYDKYNYQRQHKHALMFLDYCKKIKIKLLKEITPRHIQGFKNKILSLNQKYSSMKFKFAFIKSALKYAYEFEYINKNPAGRIKNVSMKDIEKEKIDEKKIQSHLPYRNEEIKTLLGAEYKIINRHNQLLDYTFLRDMLKVLFYTGMRKNEVCSLEWSQVKKQDDFYYLVLTAGKTKERKERRIPVHPEILEIFLELEKEKHKYEDNFVFRDRVGNIVNKLTIYRMFEMIRDRAGLNKDLTIHGTRDTFITRAAPINLLYTKLIVGHTIGGMTDVYFQPDIKTLHDFICKVEYV
jgi:integrase